MAIRPAYFGRSEPRYAKVNGWRYGGVMLISPTASFVSIGVSFAADLLCGRIASGRRVDRSAQLARKLLELPGARAHAAA